MRSIQFNIFVLIKLFNCPYANRGLINSIKFFSQFMNNPTKIIKQPGTKRK